MKLLIYDKFFDSLIKLPKSIQKKVIDFQRKFREDSKSSAIHLEPIATFKDPQLRTARIDQKYRVIVRAPESGDTYFLLWVDNHDEAMDWAANKMFQWNTHTQSIQLFSAPETEISEKETDTTSTYEEKTFDHLLFKEYTDEQLIKIGLPEILLPSLRKVKDLDDLGAMEAYLPVDAFENLFYLADGASIDNLIYEVEEGKVESASFDEQLKSINNQRSFIEFTDDEVFNEVLAGELNKWKFYLHPSQKKLVEGNFTGSAKVTGGAGTGKTVAALHRLKYLTQISKDNRPILFTTFTHALTNNLKEMVDEVGIDNSKIVIDNIDSLVMDFAKKYELIDDNTKILDYSHISTEKIWDELLETYLVVFDRDFLIAEYNQVILYHNVQSFEDYARTSRAGRGKPISRRQRKGLWDIFEKYDQYKKQNNYVDRYEVFNLVTNYLNSHELRLFAYVIADEVQDFSNVELRFIRALVEEKENDLFLVGDPLQKIYNRTIYFSKAGINVRGRKSRRLRINYRTSEEIKKLAFSVIKDIAFDDFDGEEESTKGYVSLFHGDPPIYQTFKSKDDEINFIIKKLEELKSQNFSLSEIAIAARTKDSIKDIKSALHVQSIPWFDIIDTKTGDTEGVRLSTFHSLKGLEFKVIFLVDVNDRTCPLLPYDFSYWDEERKGQHIKAEKALMYVAISRTVQKVFISGIGEKSKNIKLNYS